MFFSSFSSMVLSCSCRVHWLPG